MTMRRKTAAANRTRALAVPIGLSSKSRRTDVPAPDDAGIETPHRDARNTVRSSIILTILTLVCLAPFLGKAFHIDDPLFIWAGKQIAQHPGNPYGFTVNWYMVP